MFITTGTIIHLSDSRPMTVFHVIRNESAPLLDVIEAKPEPKGPRIKLLRWELLTMEKNGLCRIENQI